MFITKDLDFLNKNASVGYLEEVHDERGFNYICKNGKIAKVQTYKDRIEESFDSKFEPYKDDDNPNSICELMKIKTKTFKTDEKEYIITGIYMMDEELYVTDDKYAYPAIITDEHISFYDVSYNHFVTELEDI